MSEQTGRHGPTPDDAPQQQTLGGTEEVESGMTPEDIDLRARIAATLGRSAFPGDRTALTEVAESNGAEDRVLAWLRRLPVGEVFENMQAATRAMGLPVEPHSS